jgi:hypothetical protein
MLALVLRIVHIHHVMVAPEIAGRRLASAAGTILCAPYSPGV